MKRPPRLFAAIACLLAPLASVGAQERPADVGAWYMHFGQIKLADRWSLHLENQWRAYDAVSDLEQSLNRWALNYHVPGLPLLLSQGYGYIYTEPVIGPDPSDQGRVDEHRLYQQILWRHASDRLHFTHRGRIEERWIEGDYSWRFRYFLGCDIPLNRPELVPGAFYVSLYNELFLNVREPMFDRDRVYAALGHVFSDGLKVQIGFMRQILSDWENSPDQFQLSVHWNR